MRREAGFTLLEILVVLVLVGLMYSLVPPFFSTAGSSTELRTAARQIAAGLRKTRSRAILTREETAFTVNVEQRQFRVAGDAKTFPLPKQAELSVYTAQAEVVEDKVAAIRFFPDGSSTGGAVTLVSGQAKFRVDVDWLTGGVTIPD